MYARFTDRARDVMATANRIAQRHKHEYLGTEHILLGLLEQSSGVAAQVLTNLTLDRRLVKLSVEKIMQIGSDSLFLANIPHTRRAKKVIEYAHDESQNLAHNVIGTEHLLLGLLREGDGVAGIVLANFGLTLEKLRAEIRNTLGQFIEAGDRQFTQRPPTQASGEDAAPIVAQPEVCPNCGQPRIVRVIWNYVHLFDKNLEEIAVGKAILGSRTREQGPAWVCLQCDPQWSEVHQLAQQDHDLQLTKENAVAAANFEEAVNYRDEQIELRRQLDALIEELLRDR